MTGLVEKLDTLNKAASPGEWGSGHYGMRDHPCDCRSVLTDRMMGSVALFHTNETRGQFKDEYPTLDECAANMNLVVELVNAYRSGELVVKE